jgi:hypothetical protein
MLSAYFVIDVIIVGRSKVDERVGDRDISPAVAVSAGMVVPDAARWTVVLDIDEKPVAVIAPGGARVAEDLVVVDAELPVTEALRSEVLADAAATTVVVVMKGMSVVGVWSDSDLLDARLRRVTRTTTCSLPGDVQLPGRITKKNITRRCRYTARGISCASVLVVPEKPEAMPQCPARDGLTTHAFEW